MADPAATVLIVDDDAALRYALGEMLGDAGLRVVTAASGEEALGKLDGVDCVVTDVAMPGLSGLELLAAIRDKDARLPVVVLTAHGNERVAVQAMKAGAWDYLAKPFSNEELRLIVARAVES